MAQCVHLCLLDNNHNMRIIKGFLPFSHHNKGPHHDLQVIYLLEHNLEPTLNFHAQNFSKYTVILEAKIVYTSLKFKPKIYFLEVKVMIIIEHDLDSSSLKIVCIFKKSLRVRALQAKMDVILAT